MRSTGNDDCALFNRCATGGRWMRRRAHLPITFPCSCSCTFEKIGPFKATLYQLVLYKMAKHLIVFYYLNLFYKKLKNVLVKDKGWNESFIAADVGAHYTIGPFLLGFVWHTNHWSRRKEQWMVAYLINNSQKKFSSFLFFRCSRKRKKSCWCIKKFMVVGL